jgi:sugar O-acyltransferase (sialic acid O-acetyltransferase NeuD family)
MLLYGASGHGKVIKEILEAQKIEVEAFIDDNQDLQWLSGIPVLHHFNGTHSIIVSIGNNKTRKKIVEQLSCKYLNAIHPSAIVSPSARIGEGTVVMPGAIINADAIIGKHCIVNTGASIDHECVIGDYSHIAPHASLCGQVRIGEGTLIGVGASVIPCISIGKWSVIGAGSTVIEDISDSVIAVGIPAKVIKSN